MTDLPLLLVMEYVENGSLYSFLQSHKKTLDTPEAARGQLLRIGADIAEVIILCPASRRISVLPVLAKFGLCVRCVLDCVRVLLCRE